MVAYDAPNCDVADIDKQNHKDKYKKVVTYSDLMLVVKEIN